MLARVRDFNGRKIIGSVLTQLEICNDIICLVGKKNRTISHDDRIFP